MDARDKLDALRARLTEMGVDGFIVPHADEYQSEYLPPSAERLAWFTGFTGSNGAAVILPDQAAALTDGRYLIQIRQQVYEHLYEVVDITKAGVADWLAVRGKAGQVIGYDPRLHTPRQLKLIHEKISPKGLSLRPVPSPIDDMWLERVEDPILPAEVFPETIAGTSSAQKRTTIAAQLKEQGVASTVITLPDSIAWLLNIRGQDVPHNPLVLSYAVLHAGDARVDWYVDERKLTPDVRAHLGNTVTIKNPALLGQDLQSLAGIVQVDFDRSPQWFVDQLVMANIQVRDGKDPCILPKALKAPQEQAAMKAAHLRDGVAMVKFLHWFDQHSLSGKLSEMDVEAKLLEFRQQQPAFRGTSFDSIVGWAEHGAIIHYSVTPETNIMIQGEGMLLLDSGAQYSDGTTDITRTIAVGNATPEMKDRYTRVLKAHIAIASAKFPEGIAGAQLDTLARKPLWDGGIDFPYGTGHGVGCYLCVHEESARISPRGYDPVKANMIVSNEPGFHKEGGFGIRTESLILSYDTGSVCSDGRKMLAFETITLVPIDLRLIELPLLTTEERAWLNAYHDRVYSSLISFLTPDEQGWLKTATAPI